MAISDARAILDNATLDVRIKAASF